jgi:hypothetical protein
MSFYNSIASITDFFTSTGSEDMCKYDSTNKEFKMSYNCWFRMNGQVSSNVTYAARALSAFQSAVQAPMVTGACDASDIRQISTTDWFTRNLQYMYSNTTRTDYTICGGISSHCLGNVGKYYFVHPYFAKDTSTTPIAYKATLSVKKAMCAGCYQTILNELQREYTTNITATSVIENCKKDTKSALCLGTPYMADKLLRFEQCSGYAIDFVGPFCTAENMAAIAKNFKPIPYQLFVNCAVNAESNSELCTSAAVTQFLSNLNSIAGSNCYSCFTEFKTAIDGLAATDSNVVTACSTSITSDTCKAALKAPIDSFIECSGFEPSGKRSKSVMKSSIIGAIIFVGLSIAL